MVKVTVTARGLILLLSGSLSYILAWIEGDPFRLANERLSHVLAVICNLMALLHLGQLSLITVHYSRYKRKNVDEIGVHTSGQSAITDGHQSLHLLTLSFESDTANVLSSDALEQALSQLASLEQSSEEPPELSIFARDAQKETDAGEESLRKR
ncbi:hypothetical protein BGZ68_003280, partial [Mortierella alpina]